jgi:RNA 2',3'-cyclic 3'-phosphodiesterase
MKRLFSAIKIHPSKEFIRIYNELQNSLRNNNIKWVDVNNIHITLKFFGETDESQIPAINTALNQVANDNISFELKLMNAGIFGSSYNPRVIWFGIDKNPVLEKLAFNVLNAMNKIGFEKDRQNFVPHLTVGRIKFINEKKNFQEIIGRYHKIDIQKEKIENFHLFESILKPRGPEYKVLTNFILQ